MVYRGMSFFLLRANSGLQTAQVQPYLMSLSIAIFVPDGSSNLLIKATAWSYVSI